MKKVMQMITDPARVKLANKGHPDVCSVFAYYKAFAAPEVQRDCRNWCENAKKGCTECKRIMAEILIKDLCLFAWLKAVLPHIYHQGLSTRGLHNNTVRLPHIQNMDTQYTAHLLCRYSLPISTYERGENCYQEPFTKEASPHGLE